jgi:hypothetical protein
MSPVSKETADHLKSEIHEVLGQSASELFLRRVDAILEECSAGKLTVAQTCEKVQKLVSLFIDEGKAHEIQTRCAPIIAKESAAGN